MSSNSRHSFVNNYTQGFTDGSVNNQPKSLQDPYWEGYCDGSRAYWGKRDNYLPNIDFPSYEVWYECLNAACLKVANQSLDQILFETFGQTPCSEYKSVCSLIQDPDTFDYLGLSFPHNPLAFEAIAYKYLKQST